MKIKLTPASKLALLCTAVCATMLAFSPNTKALTIGDGQTLGYVFFGIPSGDQDRTDYVNHLVFMYNNGITDDVALGQTFHIVNGAPSFGATLPTAVFALNGAPGVNLVPLGAGGLFTYLFAKYDGPNQGSVVWYVGNLSGLITIPADWNGYGLSGWTLFGPGGQGVPDGGMTAMLLGTALGALGMARRFLKR
jgi:protein with PEP-CTERM/exosortase system signal